MGRRLLRRGASVSGILTLIVQATVFITWLCTSSFVRSFEGIHSLREKRDFIKSSMEQIAVAYKSEIMEWHGEDDHIHMLLRYPRTAVLSEL